MRLAIAQLNQTVGDLGGNARAILTAANDGFRAGASLVLTPELSLAGYPPEDLLLRPAFLEAVSNDHSRCSAVAGTKRFSLRPGMSHQ